MTTTRSSQRTDASSRWHDIRDGAARFPWLSLILALVIGLVGAVIFVHLRLPLPWMLGALAATTIAALLRVPVDMPRPIRFPMLSIIGVMLGSALMPGLLGSAVSWLPSLVGLTVFLVLSGSLCTLYFRRVAKLDPRTAYFAAMPGGLMEMIILGEQRGADVKVVALCQSARILLLVFTLPFLIRYLGEAGANVSGSISGNSIFEVSWSSHALLALCAAAGVVLGRVLRLPTPWLFGPFLLSGVVHLAGWSSFQPSSQIVNAAQLVLGASLGCSFRRAEPALVLRMLFMASGATAILLLTTFAFALAVSMLTEFELVALLLAYSPGGVAEMSLVALVMQVETGFVVFHHVARISMVILGARLLLDPYMRRLERQTPP